VQPCFLPRPPFRVFSLVGHYYFSTPGGGGRLDAASAATAVEAAVADEAAVA
jgi:hypothetical protein